MPKNCPDEQALRGFARGQGTSDQIDAIGDHLESCERCNDRLDRIESGDEWTRGIRGRLPGLAASDDVAVDTTMRADHERLDELAPGAAYPIRLNCPHCQEPIAVIEEGASHDAVCPACGSAIRIDPNRTYSWTPDRLPTLGRFELLRSVGQGAFGTVYRARDTDLNRIVAVKVPRSGRFTSPADEESFIREARAAGRLSHPGIVPIFDVGKGSEFPYIVAEYVDGITLADALSARRFPFLQTARIISEVAGTIHYSHQSGIIHRDLKPSNIMLQESADGDEEFRTRVMDFGLAQHDNGEVTINLDGCILGTPAYGSPEQMSEDVREIDARSDVYSMGVILYEMLTGELPFRGTLRMVIYQVVNNDPRAPRQLNDRIPRDLETICLKCMEKSPDRRYPSAGQLSDDLNRFLAGEPIAARPIGRVERARKWIRRQPAIAALLAAVFVSLTLGAAGATYYAWQARDWAISAEQESTRADARAEEARQSAATATEQRIIAEEATRRAMEEELRGRKLNYVTSLSVIPPLWEAGNVARILELLETQRPQETGGADLRGFEWYYWWTKCHNEELELGGHESGVSSMAATSNRLVAGSGGGFVHFWDLNSGERVRKIEVDKQPVLVDISHDGQRVASTGADNAVKVWEFETGRSILTLKHSHRVTALTFSRDGRRLLTGAADGGLKLWEAHSGETLQSISAHADPIASLAFDSIRNVIASAAEQKENQSASDVRLWDATTGKATGTIDCSAVSSLEFNGDGKSLVVGTLWGQDRLKVFDVASGQSIAAWARPHATQPVNAAVFGARGTVISGGGDHAVKVWSAQTQKEILNIRGHTSYISDLAVVGSSKIASASWDGTVRIWNTNRQVAREYFLGDSVECIDFSPDGSQVAGNAKGNSVRIFGSAQPNQSRHVKALQGLDDAVKAIAYSRDGTLLATGSADNTIHVWDLNEVSADSDPRILRRHTAAITSVGFGPGDAWLMSSSLDGQVILWDLAAGEPKRIFNGHAGPVLAAAVSADGQWIASLGGASGEGADFSASLVVWDAETQEPRFPPRQCHARRNSSFHPLAVSRDDSMIAVIQPLDRRSVVVLNAATGDELHVFSVPGSMICHSIDFSPDNRRLVASHLASITMWDMAVGMEVLSIPGFSDSWIQSIRFSPDGKRLGAGTYGTTIGFFDAEPRLNIHPKHRERLLQEIGR